MKRLTRWLVLLTFVICALSIGFLWAGFGGTHRPQAAAGAWVLWEERVVGYAREWRIARGNQPFTRKQACEQAASDQNDSEFKRLLVPDEPAEKILRALVNFTCLPDTEDPREPKGK